MAIDLYKNRCSVYEGEKPYVFISYSHKDIERVVTMIRKLQSLGFRIWYDSGVPAGTEWREEIAAKLKSSKCVLSLLSENSAQSRHFKVEFNYAYHLELPILVAYLDDCVPTPGVEMLVVSQQCIKREHCEDDEDLLAEIARAKILLPCRDEIENSDGSAAPRTDTANSDAELEQLKALADQGDKISQYNLGIRLQYGNSPEHSLEEAVKYYRMSADQNYPPAMRALGLCYEYGNGVTKDPWKAAHLYRMASDLNFAEATNSLGWCYETGIGVEANIETAVSLYRQAAEQGEPYAQQNLARCYEFGNGVVQDWNVAAYWFRQAAEQGVSFSQWQMAECYRKGLGVPIDEAEAARWQKLYDENPNK